MDGGAAAGFLACVCSVSACTMGIVLVVAPVQAAASCRLHYHPSARPRRRSQHRSLRRRSLCRPPCRCSLRGPRRCSSPVRRLLRSVALAGITPTPRIARRKTKPRSFRAACSHSVATPCEAARRRRSSQGHAAAPRVGRPAPPSAARLLALASVSAPPPRPPSPLARAPRIQGRARTRRSRAPRTRGSCARSAEGGLVGDGSDLGGTSLIGSDIWLG